MSDYKSVERKGGQHTVISDGIYNGMHCKAQYQEGRDSKQKVVYVLFLHITIAESIRKYIEKVVDGKC